MDLNGKVAVVTGSGQGLGAAYARALAAAGAGVVVNDVNPETAETTVKEITAAGGAAVAEVVGVGTAEAAQALVGRAVSEFGRLDAMVTNAGNPAGQGAVEHDGRGLRRGRSTFTCAEPSPVPARR